MARPTRPPRNDYVIGEGAIRLLFIFMVAGGALLLIGLLLAMSARPQGRYVTPDRTQYEATLRNATGLLAGYHEDAETGRVQIPIERAIELVAERGVTGTQFGTAAAQTGAQTGPAGTDEAGDTTTDAATPATEGDTASAALPEGSQVFANCAGCHGPAGQGVPGLAPPLAGHADDLHAAEGGRAYLTHVLLYGLQGPIVVEGNTYNGVMPAWGHLSDAEIASVLNYIVTAEAGTSADFRAYTPDDIATERELGLSPTQVHEQREALELAE
jgi:mono/diheme cytochrome c family protein